MKSFALITAIILACITTHSEAKQPCGWIYIDGKPVWVCDYR